MTFAAEEAAPGGFNYLSPTRCDTMDLPHGVRVGITVMRQLALGGYEAEAILSAGSVFSPYRHPGERAAELRYFQQILGLNATDTEQLLATSGGDLQLIHDAADLARELMPDQSHS